MDNTIILEVVSTFLLHISLKENDFNEKDRTMLKLLSITNSDVVKVCMSEYVLVSKIKESKVSVLSNR